MSEKALILFYMNGCGHCQEFMPKWKETIEKNKSSMKIEASSKTPEFGEKCNEIDNDTIDKIMRWKEVNVMGYPTIAKWNGTTVEKWKGDRDANKIAKWLNVVKGGKNRRKKTRKNRKSRKTRRRGSH